MHILTAEQVRSWDQYTIQNEPVASADLMERAAGRCVEWILKQGWQHRNFKIFCGKGNNGGDGLVIARHLLRHSYKASVFILEYGTLGTADFQLNLQRLHDIEFKEIHFIQSAEHFPVIGHEDIVIDSILGSGLNKPLKDLAAALVVHINTAEATVVAIDIPTGLYIDQSSAENTIIRANYTLTFQCYKCALLMQENAAYIGTAILLDIGLHPQFLNTVQGDYIWAGRLLVRNIFRPRNAFAHKGSFGHALLIAGSYGKIGAAVLAAKACLRSGAGLTTAFLPRCGYNIMQSSVPEAMVLTDETDDHLSTLPSDIEKYSAIGLGPGLGTHEETQQMISFITRRYHKPLVIDADGLNCLAVQQHLLSRLPSHSVLTPHPKEFDRLFGECKSDFSRLETARKKAKELDVVIVLKSHHTMTVTPGGRVYFNSTGNAGLAKGGTGDVLTGIITSLLAQHYSPADAAVFGVYLHGLAADIAVETLSEESLLASDVTNHIPLAIRRITGQNSRMI